jgi:hypothetical protein
MLSNVNSPGGVTIEQITLLTAPEAGAKEIDLKLFVGDIVIKESVFTNYLTMELAIGDSRNLIGNVPIVGGEIVTVKLVSNHLNSSRDSDIIEQSFVIASIENRMYKDDREEFYTLNCISPEGYKNNAVVINERFSGSPREIFEDIYTRYIKEPKVISEDGTTDSPPLNFLDIAGGETFKRSNICFIANYWTPYRCMNFLTSKVAPASTSGKQLMPNVKYFQSTKGHSVVSLSKLVAYYKAQGAIYDEFFYIPTKEDAFQLDEKRTTISGYKFLSPFVGKQMSTMSDLKIPFFTDDLLDQVSGYQGSMTIGFDMVTRLPYHMEFDYTSSQPSRLSQNKRTIPSGWDDFGHIADVTPMRKNPISAPSSAINVHLGASQMWTDTDFGYDWRFLVDTAARGAADAELERLKVSFTVPGRTDIDLGMLVYLNFPNTGEKSSNTKPDEVFDSRMSGVYVITGIRHGVSSADNQHSMRLDCVRDSMGSVG